MHSLTHWTPSIWWPARSLCRKPMLLATLVCPTSATLVLILEVPQASPARIPASGYHNKVQSRSKLKGPC